MVQAGLADRLDQQCPTSLRGHLRAAALAPDTGYDPLLSLGKCLFTAT